MENMTTVLNQEYYGKLLAEVMPQVIETESENERLLAEVDKLMKKGGSLSPEEEKLFDLLVTLIEKFEDEHYQLNASTPHSILLHLMEARDLKQSDLVGILGSKGVTSEVINGKRGISKAQAKALGEFFHVSPALFLIEGNRQ
jgi:HTH-type transcriptional regulator/antitoxin HigA